MQVPFFRPDIGDAEIQSVVDTLRSGWLTSGPRAAEFESRFAEAVGSKHAIAVNSCTAALHLSLDALGLHPGQGVLVPTMTFAATAEVVRYLAAVPILVDCDPVTLNLDLQDAECKMKELRSGKLPVSIDGDVVGVIPVHVGGLMMDMSELSEWARRHDLWVAEDAAHAFPAAYRTAADTPWIWCGSGTGDASCFSFYANKTITTGEGGMVTTDDDDLAGRMRIMSLHGLSGGAWDRFQAGHSWDYRIVAPGFKYNLTDIAAAIGLVQLERAHQFRRDRQEKAEYYLDALAGVDALELPQGGTDRVHSWHLFPIRLRLERLALNRNQFFDKLGNRGVRCSVHWRPLHLHPYYAGFGRTRENLPEASATWERLISLPLFPSMRDEELDHVVQSVKAVCEDSIRT